MWGGCSCGSMQLLGIKFLGYLVLETVLLALYKEQLLDRKFLGYWGLWIVLLTREWVDMLMFEAVLTKKEVGMLMTVAG